MTVPEHTLQRIRDRTDLVELVQSYGVEFDGQGWAPCPFHDERTGSFHIRGDRWKCFGCGASGDAVDFVQRAASLSFLEAVERIEGAPLPRLDPERIASGRAKRARPPNPGPTLETDEVLAFWEACRPVLDDQAVAQYLASRGLLACDVEDLDLARALPLGSLPPWARCGRESWRESGHLLVTPMFDAQGLLSVVRARAIGYAPRKTLCPKGGSPRGCLFADGLGRQLLEGESVEDVVLAEGEIDWLTWATRLGQGGEDTPAVLGLASGSWTAELAARIPFGARVVVWTDHDPAGDRYAAEVLASLEGRAHVLRAPRAVA